MVNDTNDRNADLDYITKKPLKSTYPYAKRNRASYNQMPHNITFQTYDDDKITTNTNTFVIQGAEGITRDYKISKGKGTHSYILSIST